MDFPQQTADVAIVGAGLAGLAAAAAFAQRGFSVHVCGPQERASPGRTVALFGPSLELMEAFGLTAALRAEGAPLKGLRIVDDTGSLFASRPIEFRCEEIGLESFGWNIENGKLADLIAGALESSGGKITRSDAAITRLGWDTGAATVRDASGRTVAARLVVAADGRNSLARKAAGIEVRSHEWVQTALTLRLRHTRPHGDVSTEFHTRQGPFTLVPLPAQSGAPDRSSLVWLMSPAEGRRRAELADAALTREIERQSKGLVGRIEIEGGRGLVPMVSLSASRLFGRRVALIGDAAHVFPPIGAQGLNLGLRDVIALVKTASLARDAGRDFGADDALSAYARSRTPDVFSRRLAVNSLNLSLTANLPPIDAVRALGLTALRSFPALRRRVMREGVSPLLAALFA